MSEPMDEIRERLETATRDALESAIRDAVALVMRETGAPEERITLYAAALVKDFDGRVNAHAVDGRNLVDLAYLTALVSRLS